MRRVLGDGLLSAGALAVLLTALVSIDPRVREQVTRLVHDSPTAGFSGVGSSLTEVGSVVFMVVKHHSIAHAPLVVFVVAAVILVIAMLRQ
jgi:hypothetical protein